MKWRGRQVDPAKVPESNTGDFHLLYIRPKKALAQLGKLFSLRMLAICISFLQTFFLSRFFGIDVFGQLSFALSVSLLLCIILTLGLDQVLMRNIARVGVARTAQEPQFTPILCWIRRLVFPATLLIGWGTALILAFWDLAASYRVPLIAVMLALPLALIRRYMESLLLGAKQISASILAAQIASPALMLLGIGLLWLLVGRSSTQVGIILASVLHVVATLGSVMLAFWLARPTLLALRDPREVHPRPVALRDGIESARTGWHLSLVTLGFIAGQNIDVLVIGLMGDADQVAIVRVATRVAEMAGLIRAIAIMQFKPTLAEAYGQGDRASLQRQVGMLTAIFGVSGTIVTIGLWIFAEEVMGMFGPGFETEGWLLRIYTLGIFATMICGPCNVLLAMCNQERTASRILILALVVNLMLDLLLIPFLGALGCAIANMTSLILLAGLSAWASWCRLNIDTTILGLLRRRRPKGV